jgi:hypothetical protein
MKTAKPKVLDDDLRPEYKRSDFGVMVRGKYAAKARAALKIAVLKPEIAKAFPTSEAVNDALATMLTIASESRRVTAPPKRTRKAA